MCTFNVNDCTHVNKTISIVHCIFAFHNELMIDDDLSIIENSYSVFLLMYNSCSGLTG